MGFRSIWLQREERRPRAIWRLLIFIFVAAAIANPLVLLLDATDVPLLESSLENLCVAIGFLLALWITSRFVERRKLSDYGVVFRSNAWKEGGAGFVLGTLLLSAIVAIEVAAGRMEMHWGPQTTIAGAPVAAALAGQGIRYWSGSFFEELLSRGYLLRFVAEAFRSRGASRGASVAIAVGMTSTMFGLLHLLNDGATFLSTVNIAQLGLLFAVPVLVTSRLSTSIGLHMGWNVAQNTVFGLPNGGKPTRATLFSSTTDGSETWTGGNFGPEGGLTALVVLFITLFASWLWMRHRGPARVHLALADPPRAAEALEPVDEESGTVVDSKSRLTSPPES